MFWISVVAIAFGQIERQKFSALVTHQAQLESIKPPRRTISSFSQAAKGFMVVNPMVSAHLDRCAVDKAEAGAFAQAVS